MPDYLKHLEQQHTGANIIVEGDTLGDVEHAVSKLIYCVEVASRALLLPFRLETDDPAELFTDEHGDVYRQTLLWRSDIEWGKFPRDTFPCK